MSARIETVDVDGASVRLHRLAPAGSPRRPREVVVLVHGIGMSHRSFERFQGVLATRNATIAVDLPGFGGVSGGGRPFGPERFADLLIRSLRCAGVERAVVMGQSMGAQVAIETARQCPDLVERLVLVGPVVETGHRSVTDLFVRLLRDTAHEGVRMNGVVGGDYVRSVPQYLRELVPMLRYPVLSRVADLECSVLVLRGSVDRLAGRDWCRTVAETAPQGSFLELPGPHQVQEHLPAEVAEIVMPLDHQRSWTTLRNQRS